jgi:hypothetical protein
MRREIDPLIGVAAGEPDRRNRQDDANPHRLLYFNNSKVH